MDKIDFALVWNDEYQMYETPLASDGDMVPVGRATVIDTNVKVASFTNAYVDSDSTILNRGGWVGELFYSLEGSLYWIYLQDKAVSSTASNIASAVRLALRYLDNPPNVSAEALGKGVIRLTIDIGFDEPIVLNIL